MRIYGRTHGEQALETVLTDTVVFTLLSERKLGPKLHGIFPGGRIEQYIPVSEIFVQVKFYIQAVEKLQGITYFTRCFNGREKGICDSIGKNICVFHFNNLLQHYKHLPGNQYYFNKFFI